MQRKSLTRLKLLNSLFMIQMRTRQVLFFLLTILCAFHGFSQETTSEINGIITDTAGNGLAGATIQALHVPTGSKYSTTTRRDGHYNLANLRVGGPYTITVSYVGYEPQTQENVSLLLGQAFVGDFKLSPSTQALENVVVSTTRQSKVFNNNHTGAQEIISRNQIERLPTINRSLQDFTRLTPQANGLSFGGQSNQLNNITIDGANFNNSFGLSGTLGGQTNSQPISLDAIEQVQVNLSPYDVRQGGFSGSGINSVTRSGTNEFKGSVYTYLRGPNTQGYKVGDLEVPKQDYSYNLRGAWVSGAIIKNKLFFFVSGEQERLTQPGTSYIASNGTHAPNGTTVSNANADSLNALRQFLITKYNYDPGAYQGYSYKTQSDKITAKVDWNINDNNTLSIKYNYLKSSRDINASNSGHILSSTLNPRTPGQYAMPFYGSGYTINNNFNIVIAELNSRFGNKSSNKLQVGYTALRDFRKALSAGDFPLVDILDGNGNPYTSFGYEPYTYSNILNTDVFQINDIFTFYEGSHEITIGTQNSFKKYENGFSPNYEGVYTFNSLSAFYAAAADTSVKAARYNVSYTLTPDGSFPLVGPKDQEYGFFAQDKWRATKTFTLTYGIRVDIPFFQNTFLYNPVVDTLSLFYHGIHINTGQAPKINPLFSPRAGFTWDLSKGKQNTQLRGGLGLFAGPPPFVWISNQASNSGVALFGSIDKGAGYAFSPNVNAYKPSPDTLKAGLSNSYSVNVTDPKFKFPQAFKANLALDKKLPNNWIVTIEGIYTKNINSAFFQNVNLPETGTQLDGPGGRFRFSGSKIYPVGGTKSINNPDIGNAIYMTNVNKGYAYTLTLQVQKTWRNFYASAAYTYQQSKDVMVGGSTAATMWGSRPISGDPNSAELGYSEGYLPHRIIASAFYRKEYAKHFATSVGLLFEAAPSGVGSYVYNGDFNNDGNSGNDLIYIPTQGDLATYVANGQLEASAPINGVTDTRKPEDVASQLNAFIEQDPYLSKHRGEIAKRNALVYPWFKRVDLNVTQDVYLKTGKSRHTLRLSLDITNLGNFLNSNWGIYQTANSLSFLKFDGLKKDANGNTTNTPVFSFPYATPATQTPYTQSFRNNTSALISSNGTGLIGSSRWQMQFGIRYLFN